MLMQQPLCALALSLAASLATALPASVAAQPSTQRAAQEATGFSVTPIAQLLPGEVLAFRVDTLADARVSVHISGASAELQLTETRPGRYEGEYTIRRRDKLSASSAVTARIEKNGRTTTAALGQSLQAGTGPSAGASISSFHVSAPAQVQPGDELVFALHGAPGGQASASVQGIAQRVPLTEVRPGVYEATYVLRRSDTLRGSLVADGHLVVNRRESTLQYSGGHQSPGHAVASCPQCGSVVLVKPVRVTSSHPNVLGTIAGGLLGGVLGHQVGGGTGRDLATIAGAVGGAYAGNQVQKNLGKKQVYRVTVRLDDHTTRTFDYAEDPGLAIGARVKVDNNALARL
jgi:outer membrane lipoprotein SlyB